MSDQDDFDQDLTPSQEHTIAFAVILLFGAMYLFFMKGCQPIASSIGQAYEPPHVVQPSQPTIPQHINDTESPAGASESSVAYENQQVNKENVDVAVQKVASVDPDTNATARAQTDEKLRSEAQVRDAAKIKAEAASLAAATAAQKLADEKRFEAKQAELKAGRAELAIPAKPIDKAVSQPKSNNAVPEAQNQPTSLPTEGQAAATKQDEGSQQKPFNLNDELVRVNYTLPDGRSIQIPQQGFEDNFRQSILKGGSGQAIVFDRISFFPGSDLLNPESSNQILGVAGIMNTYKDVNIKLRGHTDSSGAADDNLTLSFKRSQNLKNQLVGLGIETNRISVEGLGSSEPISDNSSEKGRNKNRRIDLTIIK